MPTAYRLCFIVAGVTTTLLLSACQPKPEDTEPTASAEVITTPVETLDTPDTEVIELDTEDSDEPTAHDVEPEMTDMLKDYMKAMGRMNDEMKIGMGYNDPDTAFAKSMLGHHRGTIDMAQIQLKYGTDAPMQQLAQSIIEAQQLEIDTLRKWLASHPDIAKPSPNTAVMQQDYADAMADMQEAISTGITEPVADMAFASSMLPLHKGAVAMALTQLKYGTDEDMRQLALQIIGVQQMQLPLLQNWITTHNRPSDNDKRINDTATDNAASETEPFGSEIIENETTAKPAT